MATKLEQLVELKEKYVAMMKNDGKEIITQWLLQLAEFIPDLEAFHWTQYTPYFNDGDACAFSVNSIYYFTYGMRNEWAAQESEAHKAALPVNELIYEDDGEYISSYSEMFKGKSELVNLLSDLVNLLSDNDELFEHAFDDHSRIIATAVREDGKIVGFDYDVSEYNHD